MADQTLKYPMSEEELRTLDYHMARLLQDALFALGDAIVSLVHPCHYAPEVRWRVFEIAPGIRWPFMADGKAYPAYMALVGRCTAGPRVRCACNDILTTCLSSPRLVLHALRQIQAATAWCIARDKGRKRAAEQVIKQQKRYIEELETEYALQVLSEQATDIDNVSNL